MEHNIPRVRPSPRIPSATYRIQFHGGFGFRAAAAILPYLAELGVTDLYASPYLKARPGSAHGYDVVAHDAINPELGSPEEYDAFILRLAELGMGHILDIVPNHMCVESSDNLWWQDLLENGPSSVHARTFDIDWDPVKKELRNKVLIPILGDQYGNVLDNGELRLLFAEGAFTLRYYEHAFPIIPKSYGHILGHRLDSLQRELGTDALSFEELLSIMTALEHLPHYTDTDAERMVERYREKEVVKRRLWRLYSDSPAVAAFIDENVRLFNGTPGVAESFDLLDRLLAEQVYRISHWRVATEEINYRRFFDINALGAIRVEDEAVFDATHGFILQLVGEGKVTGLRVDHVDGLYNPAAYLHRLQEKCLLALAGNSDAETAGAPAQPVVADQPAPLSCYVVGEKILMHGERLPRKWPVHGATGYAFLGSVGGLFVDSGNERKFDAIYGRFIHGNRTFPEVATEAKRLVMQVSMSSEINTLSHLLNTLSERNRHTRDFTLNSLTKAVVEVIASFPVYRTYIRDGEITLRDRQNIEQAVAKARRHNPAMDSSIFDFIRHVLLLRCPAGADREAPQLFLDFVMRFQQLTGPVMAKGVEDTACYCYNRLLSLNEVGCSPDRFGSPVEAFHLKNMERLDAFPLAMITTSTHDTKRSEDVRARISVLSEIPEEWRKSLVVWSQINRKRRQEVDGRLAPSRNEEYLLYQTLLGVWPHGACPRDEFRAVRQRVKEYMRKAIREAKVNSSWVNPNTAYEQAVDNFLDAILASGDTPFVRSLVGLAERVSRHGMFNSLSQTLLKITSPGVPDLYQGMELWDLSLVDPDNRRPVDFSLRREMLRGLRQREEQLGPAALCRELLDRMEDGAIKLYLTGKGLRYRRDHRHLFEQGSYLPLAVTGKRAASVVAFMRAIDGSTIIVVAPRLLTRLLGDECPEPLGAAAWEDTAIQLPEELARSTTGAAGGEGYRNIFTGETVAHEAAMPLASILRHFPVALLESGIHRPTHSVAQ